MDERVARSAEWRKSSYSSQNGNCVETASLPGAVAVRDSKDPAGAVLVFSAQEWRAFTARVAGGEFSV